MKIPEQMVENIAKAEFQSSRSKWLYDYTWESLPPQARTARKARVRKILELWEKQGHLKEMKAGLHPVIDRICISPSDWQDLVLATPTRELLENFPIMKTPWGMVPSKDGIPFYFDTSLPRGAMLFVSESMERREEMQKTVGKFFGCTKRKQ